MISAFLSINLVSRNLNTERYIILLSKRWAQNSSGLDLQLDPQLDLHEKLP